jgi:hypothetical protein
MFGQYNSTYKTPTKENNCRKLHRCLINTGVEQNEQHVNIDYNFDH